MSNDAQTRSSSTDTNRHVHRWTHMHTHMRMQNKHTQGFGVLVSICGEAILSLSLWLSPSLTNSSQGGSYCGHVTRCCCCCSLCVWIRASVYPHVCITAHVHIFDCMCGLVCACSLYICPSLCLCMCVCELTVRLLFACLLFPLFNACFSIIVI